MDIKNALVDHFYKDDHMFQLGAKYLSKVVTVAKMTGDEQDIKFASFIIAELNNYILAFLNVIKTSFSHQRQGIAFI